METSLSILCVEEHRGDAERIHTVLKSAGLQCTITLATDEASFLKALAETSPAVILSEFSLPRLDGLAPLKLARAHHPGTPFIFVSQTLSEEHIVQSIRHGATDFVWKEHLERLPAAILRALKEQTLIPGAEHTEEQYRTIFENTGTGMDPEALHRRNIACRTR